MAVKKYDIFGLGNAIMDLQVSASEEVFAPLGLERGSMNLVETERQSELLSMLGSVEVHQTSGGSAANTVLASTQLGSRCAYTCVVGDDDFGTAYLQEMRGLGVDILTDAAAGGVTGSSLILVTPDAERTMNTHLGITATLSAEHIDAEALAASEWLYIEGYLFSSEASQAAVVKAIEIAKAQGVKIATTFSDAFIVGVFGEPLAHAVSQSDLVFANLTEGQAFSSKETPEDVFKALNDHSAGVCLTLSEKGALVGGKDGITSVDAYPISEVDATGAGDMFAGGVLYGLSAGKNLVDSSKIGSFLASKVVSQMGARLSGDPREEVKAAGLL